MVQHDEPKPFTMPGSKVLLSGEPIMLSLGEIVRFYVPLQNRDKVAVAIACQVERALVELDQRIALIVAEHAGAVAHSALQIRCCDEATTEGQFAARIMAQHATAPTTTMVKCKPPQASAKPEDN